MTKKRLLTQNSELREINVHNWTLPAWVVTLSDGRVFNACPSAGVCAELCYARNGTYLFPKVRAAHVRNLEMVLDDLAGWKDAMLEELAAKRFRPNGKPRENALPPGDEVDEWLARWANGGGAAVRVHDAGDFFSDEYLQAWLEIAELVPDVLFYAYTKEIDRFRRLVEPNPPVNLRWIYSTGGRQDALIDRFRDRHAEVFADEAAIEAAGYVSQEASDLYAVTLQTTRVGLPANNIPGFRRKQGSRTFGELQQDRHSLRRAQPSLFASMESGQREA